MKNVQTCLVLLMAGSLGAGMSACGDDDSPAADAQVASSDGGTDAGAGDWTDLVAGNWHLAPNSEGYFCATHTLTEKTYVGGFKPINPVGTHHTVVSYGPANGADSNGAPCSAGTENPNWIYASGVGTGELILPDGVGVVLEAGQQVHVNLHLFNTSDAALDGRSGVQIMKLDPSKVTHEAELFLPGPLQFTIPKGQTYSVTGNCTIEQNQTIFALFPHMHQTGTHFKTEIVRAGAATETLWDAAYNFESQPFFNFTPVELKAGDKLATTCTWNNTTDANIGFGQSSKQEMCFSILMRYPRQPASQTGNFCWDGP
jgi:hypothetical protein